jgi:hypothetical protein
MKRIILIALTLLGGLVLAGPARAQTYSSAAGIGDAPMIVDYWYRHYLHRGADSGAAGWIAALQRGQQPEAVLATILSSTEYYTDGGGTPTGFIAELFHDLVGREPSAREMAYWLQRLRYTSRRDVAYEMLVRHPQSWPGLRRGAPYVPYSFPDPNGPNFPDPAGPYFGNYEYRRPIRAFPLGNRG